MAAQLGRLSRLWHFLRDALYTPACISCQTPGERWCATCRENIPYISPPYCPTCGYPMPTSQSLRCWACKHLTHLEKLRAVALHGSGIAPAIHAFKYQGQRDLNAELGQLLADHWHEPLPHNLLIIPVPLGQHRHWQRGYNQAAALAQSFATLIQRPMLATALQRTRETRPQVGLGLNERQQNVAQAFRVLPSAKIAERPLLLIDDVCTTGATLEACATALKTAGAASVWAYTLTRAARADHPA